jgi:hypothetical protein
MIAGSLRHGILPESQGNRRALHSLENRRMHARTFLPVSALILFGFWIAQVGMAPPKSVAAAEKAEEAATPRPVNTSMHDFMEGVFQAPYRRLKTSMSAEPKDNAGWKAIRSDALILAEGGNLLLLRKPAKDGGEWAKYSIASRDAGAELFKAAKAKDFAKAKKAYETMLTHCNACHKKFDEENHQLKP